MNNKAINEFGFRGVWGIKQNSEGVIQAAITLASLFHHVGRRNKSLCNSLFEFMFRFCNTCFQSTYLALFSLVRRRPEHGRKVIEDPSECKLEQLLRTANQDAYYKLLKNRPQTFSKLKAKLR